MSVLASHSPAEFWFNRNQTHMNKLIKIRSVTRKLQVSFYRGWSWTRQDCGSPGPEFTTPGIEHSHCTLRQNLFLLQRLRWIKATEHFLGQNASELTRKITFFFKISHISEVFPVSLSPYDIQRCKKKKKYRKTHHCTAFTQTSKACLNDYN